MKDNKPFSLRQRLKSFGFALDGFLCLLKTEHNFRIHLLAAILVISFGLFFEITKWEWIAVILCISGVISAEAINSSLEKICDVVSPQKNSVIGMAKDMAAFAVLILALAAFAIGCLIFIPYLIHAIKQNFN